MSYLDLPRIHFGGLFFTNPNTINNAIQNYDPSRPPNPVFWNPLGVAELWLAECSVLSVAGPTGVLVTDPQADPVIGASVQSPSSSTPKPRPDGKGDYDTAKMVDLDPQQQLRSAVYGLRLYLALAGGSGFSGLMTVPELQFLNGRVQIGPPIGGSWTAVGTWMGQIADVTWSGDFSASPFLTQFQAACAQGVAVKLTIDLHQNVPASKGLSGNEFCYGRVHGSLGPIRPGELAQVVPGRMLQVPQAPASAPAAAAVSESAAAPAGDAAPASTLVSTREKFFGNLAAAQLDLAPQAAADSAPPPAPWNPAPAQVTAAGTQANGALLHLDLGGSILIGGSQDPANQRVGRSDGKFVVDSGIAVGVQTAAGTFQPLRNGQVSFANQYQLLNSQNKEVNLVRSAGLVDIPLTADEASLVAGLPLVIQVSGTTVLQEPQDGLLLGTQPLSLRLEPATSGTVQLMARSFGQPVAGQQPMTWQISDSSGAPSTDIVIAWVGPTDANGLAALAVSTPTGDVTLPPPRQPLETQLYLVSFLDPTGQPVGDGYGQGQQANASLSVLRFQSFEIPAQPNWNQDVGPILQAYARLYPGMNAILDIGDETTVQGAAPFIYGRMSLPILDPAYMPVTRDLAPARIQTVLNWLKGFMPGPGS